MKAIVVSRSERTFERARSAFEAEQYVLAEELCILLLNRGAPPELSGKCRLLRGRIQLALGKLEAALGTADVARADGSVPEWDLQVLIGDAETRLGHWERALAAYQRATAVRPSDGAIWSRMGQALLRFGRTASAVEALCRAHMLGTRDFRTDTALARALLEELRMDAAKQVVENCVATYPEEYESWILAGDECRARGDNTSAARHYTRAMELAPGDRRPVTLRAFALLACGDWVQGWADYEARHSRPFLPVGHRLLPWQPGLPVGTVLLWDEQGAGDSLQFVRYASQVRARGYRTLLYGIPRFLEILASSQAFDEAIPRGSPLPRADYHSSLMSLPARLGLGDTFTPAVPYLRSEPALVARWRMKLPQAGAHVKIGLVWKGNPCYRDDRTRSPGLSAVLPIVRAAFECLGRDRIAIYALQKEVTRDEAEVLDREGICDLSDELDQGRDAFVDTAAVMSSVDLVISSDTSAAHLAGALGVPVWILVAACPDWRWGTVGASSPWYPSARLFRQSTMGDWSVPVSEASSAIREMVISCESEHVKRSGIQSSEVDGS